MIASSSLLSSSKQLSSRLQRSSVREQLTLLDWAGRLHRRFLVNCICERGRFLVYVSSVCPSCRSRASILLQYPATHAQVKSKS